MDSESTSGEERAEQSDGQREAQKHPEEPKQPEGQGGRLGSYQVVARRYRPKGFGELIGQEHIVQALSNAILTDRVGHAYLFTGARGVGKTSSARIFAKALNCEQGPTVEPCNECEICRAISSGDDVDVLEIDGASNRGIGEAKELLRGSSIRPSRARYKIYIIDEVHMLTREAFNALLKTLEEPPPHVKFIFCTTEPTKLPITILSRCQRYDFAGISAATIARHLEFIVANEQVTVEPGVCETIARRAGGSMRDAQSLLEQLLSFAPKHIRLSDLHGMLGTVDDRKIYDLLAAIQSENIAELFALLNRSADEGVDFGVLLEQMLGTFRDLLVITSGCGAKEMIYSSLERYAELKAIADALGPERIIASMQTLDQTITRMRYSTQGRVLAELALVRLAQLGRMEKIADLIARLKEGKFPALSSTITPALPPSPNSAEKKKADLAAPSPSVASSALEASVPEASTSDSSVPEAAKGEQRALGEHSPEECLKIWREATRSLGAALSAQAQNARSVTLIPPDCFRVTFPDSIAAAMDYCEREKDQILAALARTLSTEVRLEFQSVETPAEAPTEAPPVPKSKFELMRMTIDHPMVREASKLFGAELSEVKPGNS